MANRIRPTVDRQLCIGSGMCARSAPATFAQGEDGVSRVVSPEPDASEYPGVIEAAELCPVQAIGLG
jgi:ferredoxin